MSRVYAPTGVGNDFVVKINRKIPKINDAEIPATSLLVPKTEPVQQMLQPDLPEPAPQIGTMALASPFISGQSSVSYDDEGTAFLNRTRLGIIISCVALLCVLTGSYGYRHRLMAVASDFKYVVKQLVQEVPKSQAVARPTVSPEQITVASSNTDSAISSLVSQSIVFNIGQAKINATQASIISWLSVNNHGSNTVISVNESGLKNYLNQLVASSSHAPTNRVIVNQNRGLPIVKANGQDGVSVKYSQSVYNQIAKTILKGNGMTLQLQTATTPYQTVVSSSK